MPALKRQLFFFGLSLAISAHAREAGQPSAQDIIAKAHKAAGGQVWLRPKTLHLIGRATMYPQANFDSAQVLDHYEMWREFPAWNDAAHSASGRVRIDGKADGKIVFQISYDGKNTYNQLGLMPEAKAQAEWSEAFGFGIIRFALNPGFTHQRLGDDLVDGKRCYTVLVTDPKATQTTFWIDQKTHAIRKVGFDTPKGWHERVYSNFYRLDNGWVQPRRVRLTYRGQLSNDIVWLNTEVNRPMPLSLFVLKPNEIDTDILP